MIHFYHFKYFNKIFYKTFSINNYVIGTIYARTTYLWFRILFVPHNKMSKLLQRVLCIMLHRLIVCHCVRCNEAWDPTSPTEYIIQQHSSLYYAERKRSHFDLKSWVTGRTKIRPWIPSNSRHWESIDIESQFELTLNIESIWLKYSPITRNLGSNFSFASDSTF